MRKTVTDKVNEIVSTLEATILGVHREAIDSAVIPINLNVMGTTTDVLSEIVLGLETDIVAATTTPVGMPVAMDLEINTSGSIIDTDDDFDGEIADSDKKK